MESLKYAKHWDLIKAFKIDTNITSFCKLNLIEMEVKVTLPYRVGNNLKLVLHLDLQRIVRFKIKLVTI